MIHHYLPQTWPYHTTPLFKSFPMTPYGVSWAWNWRLAVVWGPPCFPALTFPPSMLNSSHTIWHSIPMNSPHSFSPLWLCPYMHRQVPLHQMLLFMLSAWQPPTHTAKPRLCYLFHEACPDLPHRESLSPIWVPSGPKLSSTTILNTVYGK